jgi:hypothetical protein
MCQHFLATEASQFKGHATDFVELIGVGIEEKQNVACLREQSLRKVLNGSSVHGMPIIRYQQTAATIRDFLLLCADWLNLELTPPAAAKQ